jgi:hypothetical protein
MTGQGRRGSSLTDTDCENMKVLFEYALGKYGCPNCGGANGAARPIWGNQTPGGQNKLGPSKDRWKLRSKTYQGIADAMAEQWG